MTKKFVGLLVLILLAVAAFVLFSRSRSKQQGPLPLTFGAVLPQTGFVANWGENQQKGIALALEQLGNPTDLKVLVEDSGSDPKKAVSAAQKLLSIDHATVLYTPFTAPTVAVAPVAHAAGALQLYEAAVTKPVADFPDTSLKVGYYEHSRDCKLLADYMVRQGFKRVAAIISQTDQALECMASIKQSVRNAIQFDDYKYEINKEDFRTIVTKVKAAKPDAMIATGYEGDFMKLYKALKEFQVDTPFLCVAREDCLLDTEVADAPEGAVSFGGQVSKEFESLFKSKYPDAKDFNVFSAATAYTSVRLVKEALDNCPNRDLPCLKKSMENSRLPTALVTSGFEGNKLQLNPVLVILKHGTVMKLE